ncbi:MAG TPA: dihydrofolate reductase family protein, partial [Herpetosiphonaceae bacterium]|nr:dihydrofolate reductase family protein [Herpetosiphonaceae bacterium]
RRALGDDPAGFDTPYKVPHFVLSHAPRPPVARDGVGFAFVSGIEAALAQARAAAGGKTVCVAGGAQTARQFIEAGLIDEIHLHLGRVLVGGGLRLFADGGAPAWQLERIGLIEGDGVTHLRFRVLR